MSTPTIEMPVEFLFDHLTDDSSENAFLAALSPLRDLLLVSKQEHSLADKHLRNMNATAQWVEVPDTKTKKRIYQGDYEAFAEAILDETYHSKAVGGLATAMLITSSDLLKASLNFVTKDRDEQTKMLRQGPKTEEAHWANALVCAANYVRHAYEWKAFYLEQKLYEFQDSGLIEASRQHKGLGMMVTNLEELNRLGFSLRELFSADVTKVELVEALCLLEDEQIHKMLVEWVRAILPKFKHRTVLIH